MKHNSTIMYTRLNALAVIVVLTVELMSAQITSIQLPTAADSASSFRILDNNDVLRMKLNADGGFYIGSPLATGVIPATGPGIRFMWYPAKSALRAGYIGGSEWNDANIGAYSVAMGCNTLASGNSSIALGNITAAINNSSTAMGMYSVASGGASTAFGYGSTASGFTSTAMGYYTSATNDYSTSMGYQTVSSGGRSIAIGDTAVAMGYRSTAIGYKAIASGSQTVALGSLVTTNTYGGSFVFGDASTSSLWTLSSANNQMTMRFAGGYRLYTDPSSTIGVTLAGYGNSWVSVSDARKKEKYIKAVGEYFLDGLSKLNLGSWNYIGQDVKHLRHYGPMAQEIFRYFGEDDYGTIGNDTTLATADMDGIMMICLQALERRTTELKNALDALKTEKEKIAAMEKQNLERDKLVVRLASKIEILTNSLSLSATKD